MFTKITPKGSNRRHPRECQTCTANEPQYAGADCLGLAGMHLVSVAPTDQPTVRDRHTAQVYLLKSQRRSISGSNAGCAIPPVWHRLIG